MYRIVGLSFIILLFFSANALASCCVGNPCSGAASNGKCPDGADPSSYEVCVQWCVKTPELACEHWFGTDTEDFKNCVAQYFRSATMTCEENCRQAGIKGEELNKCIDNCSSSPQ